jgi:hypothetical protein
MILTNRQQLPFQEKMIDARAKESISISFRQSTLDPWFANAYGLVVDNDLGVDQKIKLAKEFIDRYSEQPRRRTGFETVLKTLTTSEQSCRVPYRG